jgi:hypothetical protein
LDRRLGGLQSRSGRGDEERNSQSLPVAKRCTVIFRLIKIEPVYVDLHSVASMLKYFVAFVNRSKHATLISFQILTYSVFIVMYPSHSILYNLHSGNIDFK